MYRRLVAQMLGEDLTSFGVFQEENDGGTGGATGGSSGEGTGSGSGTGTGAGTGAGANARTYTEAEMNAILSERDTLKGKLTTFEQSQLTEQQKLEQRAIQAEQDKAERDGALKQERVERAIERESRKLNIVDEDTALKLLDQSKIQYDDAGKPKNIAELLGDLVKAKPFLVAVAGGGASATNASRNGSGAPATVAERIDQDFAKHRGSSNGFRIA